MADFDITLNYLVVDGKVHMTSASISAATDQVISESCSTSVSANGDINLDKGDTANLTFNLGNDDNWALSHVQLKDKDKDQFGAPEGGGNALDDDEEIDYPDVPQRDGTLMAQGTQPMSLTIRDTNQKNKAVDYQVVFADIVTGQTAVSDPRIRDSGGLN
ncbi:MAG: hypothetical protein CMP07_01635 [Xanthomonadales bacterium]|nr:hypothetical protein [Xanthomonadales bacterium]